MLSHPMSAGLVTNTGGGLELRWPFIRDSYRVPSGLCCPTLWLLDLCGKFVAVSG